MHSSKDRQYAASHTTATKTAEQENKNDNEKT